MVVPRAKSGGVWSLTARVPTIVGMRTITPTLADIPLLTLPPFRPARPSEAEVNAAITYLTGLVMGRLPGFVILLSDDLRGLGEQFLWQCRRLNAGEVPSLPLPTRLPKIGEFYSREWGCPCYLVEDRRRHVFD